MLHLYIKSVSTNLDSAIESLAPYQMLSIKKFTVFIDKYHESVAPLWGREFSCAWPQAQLNTVNLLCTVS
jgi:hypothetical protein